jgi:hypothetical protein
MNPATLKRRLRRIQRQTIRLEQAEVRQEQARRAAAAAQRRERTSRLFGLGGLVVVAGLRDFDKEVVLGALLRAGEIKHKPERAKAWRRSGRAAMASWARSGKDPARPMPRSDGQPAVETDIKWQYRALIEWGGLIEKAGFGWDEPVLVLGVLLAIARSREDPTKTESWKQTARAQAAVEARAKAAVEFTVVRFPGRISRAVGGRLKKIGMRFRRQKRLWTGDVDPSEAHQIAGPAGGEVLVLKPGIRRPDRSS